MTSSLVQAQPEPRRGVVVEDVGDAVGAEFAFQRAATAYLADRHDQAVEAIGQPQDDVASRYLRGLNYLAASLPGPAINDLSFVVGHPQGPLPARVDLAAAYLMAGQTNQAEAAIAPYLSAVPDDPFARYLMGTIRFRQERYDDALREFDAAQVEPTLGPSIEDYRRRISENQGYDPQTESKELFRTPDGEPTMEPYRERIEHPYEATILCPPSPRRWHLTVLSAFEYDTNVPLAPDVIGLGATQQHDTRFLIASFGDFLIVQREAWNLGLLFSTLDTFQFEQDDFNVQDYMGGGYSNVAIRNFILGVNYQFHETLIGNEQFAAEHRLVPSVTMMEGFGHSTVYYEYDHADIDAPALIPAQFRSGDTNTIGVTQAIYLPRDGRIFGGYRFAAEDTDGSDFDRQTHMVTGRVELPITRRLVADAEVRYFWDDYENPNSLDFFERPRSDNRVEVRAGLQCYFRDHLSLRFDYTYVDSQSNVANLFDVEFFTYNRNVFSTQLIYEF